MTQRTLAHATLVMDRTYNAAPARVFAAWESVEARKRWSSPAEHIRIEFEKADFREGGRDLARYIEPGTADYIAQVHYLDIKRDHRIVFTEDIGHGKKRILATLVSVELTPRDAVTNLLLTIQIASFDGSSMQEGYEGGWGAALDNLAKEF